MTAEHTPRLALPYLMPAQAQKHVTVNEAIRRLDALVQIAVKSRQAVAPDSPEDGEGWIVPDGGASGVWAGSEPGDLAVFQDGAWARFAPRAGWLAYIADEDALAVFDGTAWRETGGTVQNLPLLGVGTEADADNPFAARLNAALWAALETGEGGTGDLRYVMNKQRAQDFLTVLFQSGWSGRAEIGLAGDDDLAFKVSADGADWREALKIDRTSGALFATDGRALYHQGNIVGPVSQSDGAPGGAVIESGANANGRYIRWADGSQLCWRSISIGSRIAFGSGEYGDPYRTDSQNWIFPAAFIDPPALNLTALADVGGGAGRGIVAHARAVTASGAVAVQATAISASAANVDVIINLQATGRWF